MIHFNPALLRMFCWIAALFGAVLFFCFLVRTHGPAQPDPCFAHPEAGRHLDVVLDTSASDTDALGPNIMAVAHLTTRLDPQTDTVKVYALDHDTTELTDGCAPLSSEAFQQRLVAQIGSMPPAHGTYPDRFWTAFCRERKGQHAPAAVAIFSDADVDDMGSQALHAMRDAARQIAADPNIVCVCFYGVHRENRALLHTLFAPLGSRLHLYEPGAEDTEALATALLAARHAER